MFRRSHALTPPGGGTPWVSHPYRRSLGRYSVNLAKGISYTPSLTTKNVMCNYLGRGTVDNTIPQLRTAESKLLTRPDMEGGEANLGVGEHDQSQRIL